MTKSQRKESLPFLTILEKPKEVMPVHVIVSQSWCFIAMTARCLSIAKAYYIILYNIVIT